MAVDVPVALLGYGTVGAAVNRLVVDPTNPGVLYAVAEGNYGMPRGFRGLFKSTDSGGTWSAINNGLAGLINAGAHVTGILLDPINPNVLYMSASGLGVFKTSDGGANWSQLNDGLSNRDVRVLAIAPGAGHAVYAGTSGGVFKLVDDGR